tara:strand:- start:1861 stop:2484 length:624 start_codon:yes stop_codon:yes gene_type:complete
MKKLITLLLVLLTLNGYSQTPIDYPQLVSLLNKKGISVEDPLKKDGILTPVKIKESPSPINTDSLEIYVYQRINEVRKNMGLDTFTYDNKAAKIASIQTDYIVKYKHRSHKQIYGKKPLSNPMDRAHTIDSNIGFTAEAIVGKMNIVLNNNTDLKELSKDLVQQWLDSEGHRIMIICDVDNTVINPIGLSFKYDYKELFLVGTLIEY